MPNSLKCKIKHLCHNGTLNQSECDRLLRALEREPCEDAVSRKAVLDAMSDTWKHICFVARRKHPTKGEEAVYSDMCGTINRVPPVTPKPLDTVLDEIRAEIDEQYDRVYPYNISCAEGLEMALEIIDKYKAESEG